MNYSKRLPTMADKTDKSWGKSVGESRSDENKVEAGDPDRIRYGCFVPDLTGLATGPSTDFRPGI